MNPSTRLFQKNLNTTLHDSHKFNQAGVDYKLGLSVFENRFVWMNGPYPAAESGIQILRDLYKSRLKYNENYPLVVFRKHIDQEQ
jgi:hypothetical protein